MAAHDIIMNLIVEYFEYLGYNPSYSKLYFSNLVFKELISIRLANANLIVQNKSIKSSHQTHIAITGEAINFFYSNAEFEEMDTSSTEKVESYVSSANLNDLNKGLFHIADTRILDVEKALVTVGKRTQKQLQLSKKNKDNDIPFNMLRMGLFENDLLILLKYREKNGFMTIGIPHSFYRKYIPNYSERYETNTYLLIPQKEI